MLKCINPHLILFCFLGFPLIAKEQEKIFLYPKSTLDAAERVIDAEKDPYKRLQLLLRWIRIKEEYDKSQIFDSEQVRTDELNRSKREIINRIEKEIESLSRIEDLNIEDLYRELGFRYLEIQEYEKSYRYFLLIQKKTAGDYLALGDAYVQVKSIDKALQAYSEASKTPRLMNTAAYKKAWAYMQLNEFEKALEEFSTAISPGEHSASKLRAEAYRDRIRPYLETFQKTSFDEVEANEFKRLANSIYPEDPERQKQIYVDALKSLVEGFTAKSEIEKAQDVFHFLTKEITDTTEILIISAHTWIKVYRGRLQHDSVERILHALPKKEISIKDSGPLRAELHNTAVFYETLVHDENRTEHKPILLLTYGKYFELYPRDSDADSLRVNYSRLLLNDGNAGTCLDILSKRKGDDEQIEELASSLEGKCKLKHLDQLYVKPHDDFFYQKLHRALLVSKIYLRPDLGIGAEQAFESMARMLIGALQKNPQSRSLRTSLKDILNTYPYSKESSLHTELHTISAELRFQDLVADKRKDFEKAGEFFSIYQSSPPGTSVAEKSLTNSIIMSRDQDGLNRCDVFQKVYSKNFEPESPVFSQCIQLAEHFLQIEKEYSYWAPLQKQLNEAQSIRLGLLELALKKDEGRKRIERINTERAKLVLENWEGAWPKNVPLDSRWNQLEKKVRQYLDHLKPISFEKIQKEVPAKIKAFDETDLEILRYSETKPHLLYQARALELRSELTQKFANWMKSLPEPTGLSEEELSLYRQKAAEVLLPWTERAEKRKKECSELAHSLTEDFKEASQEYCPEATPESIYKDFLVQWRSSIQRTGNIQRMIQIILQRARAASTEDPLKARYYLFRALDLAKNNREKARVFLALAQLTQKERFWRQSAALDGALIEPIQWLKENAAGNPFFEKLYDREIRILRRWNNKRL